MGEAHQTNGRSIQQTRMNYEEMITALADCESIINS